MISRLALIGLFLLISFSCEKRDYVVITGIVTDEVSGSPVVGALVGLKLDFTYDGAHYSRIVDNTTTETAFDGSYRIVYDSGQSVIGAMNLTWPFPKDYNVYASAQGFAGSDLHSLSDNNLKNADIKLYHFAQLNFHVKNDGINNLINGYIWIDRGLISSLSGSTEYYFICKGQNLDTTFIINNMWGNFNYYYGVMEHYSPSRWGRFPIGTPVNSGTIIPKPDSITELFITF